MSSTLEKRLSALEQSAAGANTIPAISEPYYNEKSECWVQIHGGFAHLPVPLAADEWERLAVAHQAALTKNG